MHASAVSVVFWALVEAKVVSLKQGKAIAPNITFSAQLSVEKRSSISSDNAFKLFLFNRLPEQGKLAFIEQLKKDRPLARSIGKTEWIIDLREPIRLFVSEEALKHYQEQPVEEGPQEDLAFMRTMILETFDDNNP